MSTAVLSVSGVASAAPVEPFAFTTADSTTAGAPAASVTPPTLEITVPAGYCGIAWGLFGGHGGAGDAAAEGSPAGQLGLVTEVAAGDVFTLVPGTAGQDFPDSAGGTNAVGHDGEDGDTANGGGGGGAASEVTKDGAVYLLAYGGDGGGAGGGAGYGDGSNVYGDDVGSLGSGAEDINGESTETGDGAVAGIGVLCATPEAPYMDSATGGDGSVTVRFFAPEATYDDGEPVRDDNGVPRQEASGYEASVDGGKTWKAITTKPGTGGDEALYGTVGKLTNGKTYEVQVRATSLVGPSAASDPVTATPEAPPIAGPDNVKATVGASSIRISWEPPAGVTGIEGYEAWAIPGAAPQSSQGIVFCPDLTAESRSCVLGVEAGQEYTVGVAALGSDGARGNGSFLVTDVVPAAGAPAEAPTDTADFTADGDQVSSVTAGEEITLTGDGYLPGSTVALFIYSTPTPLGSVVADENGAFSVTVTIPEGLEAGTHSLVASGVDPSGNPRYLRMDVTLAGAEDTGPVLADTGFSAFPFVTGGLLALTAGAGLLVASRRRVQ